MKLLRISEGFAFSDSKKDVGGGHGHSSASRYACMVMRPYEECNEECNMLPSRFSFLLTLLRQTHFRQLVLWVGLQNTQARF